MNESDSSEESKLPMALFTVEHSSKKRLLFDVSSRKLRGVSSSAFPYATCAFENGGWLLILQQKPPDFKQQAVFLVHPSTARQLDLPPLSSSNDGLFVFYVNSHGAPLVVARIETLSFVPTVHIACPGDVYWSVYSYKQHDTDVDPPACTSRAAQSGFLGKIPEPVSIADVALLGTQAVCLDANGEIIVFDITEMTWRRRMPVVSPDSGFRQYTRSLVAADGEVLLVSRPRTMENTFRFFKLDMEELEWSPLERRELDDASWFLCKGQSFRAKEAGKRRVYTFDGPEQCGSKAEASVVVGRSLGLNSVANVYAYDLDDGSVEMVIPESIVKEESHWVRPNVFASTSAT
ncbi:unnamed protein product [Urochloa decumbens]|uniref:KIB1-4 beta-propeller domain-containing protein n=1 Tax=Urochloa decumbens TaxID=240449 RepID=A0ABC9E2F4_9POAL